MSTTNFENIKFYAPEVGLDEAKTAKEHFQDLRYYVADGNIPAIEKIQDICEQVHMPFEADICKFAKESVEIENAGVLDYNIGDIKKDIAESLRDDRHCYVEIEQNSNGRESNILLEARMPKDETDINKAEVSIALSEAWTENGKEMNSFGSARISFEEFKQMAPSGFHVERPSFESLLNEILAYAPVQEVEPWKPEPQEKAKSVQRDLSGMGR